jgi:hypothetical protein
LQGDSTFSVLPLLEVRHSPPMKLLNRSGRPGVEATPMMRGHSPSTAAVALPASTPQRSSSTRMAGGRRIVIS